MMVTAAVAAVAAAVATAVRAFGFLL